MKNDAIIRYDESPGSLPPCPPVPSPESQAEKLRELLLDIVDEKLAEIIVTALTEDVTDEEIPSARAVWGLKEEVDQMSEYADQAAASAAAAAGSADDAETAQSAAEDAAAAAASSATAAAGSATAAAESATSAASSATSAADDATDAASAKTAAEAAQAAAEAAVTAAEAAGAEQIELIEAAGASERESLSGYTTRAETAATNAEASAESIQGSVSDAAEYAAAAGSAATDAAASATQAVTAKTAAQSAKTAAEAAQAAAEAAQGDAEAAATAAETAQTAAEEAQTAAESAQSDAEDAATAAEGSATDAGNSATAAAASEEAADASADAAEASATAADASADAAAASAAAAEAAATDVLNKATVITDTASGAIASFPDGSAAPIKQLTVAVNPVQDLHGYDNPWPAGGGKNKLPLRFYSGVGYNVEAGTVFDTATEYTDGTISGNKITFAVGGWGRRCMLSDRLVSGESYYISMEVTSANLRFTWYTLDADLKTVRKYEVTGSGTSKTVRNPVTMSETECYIAIYLGSSAQGDISFTEPQIEVGNAKTAYAPYSNECPITGWTGADVTVSPTLDAQDGQTYPITFPSEAGTVYGGTLTVNQDGTGTLLDDHALWLPANLSTAGAIAETINGYPCVSIVIAALKSYETRADIKCSHFPFLGNTAADVKPYGIVNRTASYYNVAFCAPDLFTTVAEFRAWVTTNNCTLFAPRGTPQTYTMTAEEMTTLFGQNNWWADTGDVSVTYRADTKLYIDKKLAALVAALS